MRVSPLESYEHVDRSGLDLDWAAMEKKALKLTARDMVLLELVGIGFDYPQITRRLKFKNDSSASHAVSDLYAKLGIAGKSGINQRSIVTQLWERMKSRPMLNAFDDSAPDEKWHTSKKKFTPEGYKSLSPTEKLVAKMAIEQVPIKEIAEKRHITVRSVYFILARVYEKLSVHSLKELKGVWSPIEKDV